MSNQRTGKYFIRIIISGLFLVLFLFFGILLLIKNNYLPAVLSLIFATLLAGAIYYYVIQLKKKNN